uniref:Uncharacterized protein n=1 Tax=Opuntia streptacantha TaxID=393608 RepID=A0A7C9E2H5_OPUST
MTICMYVLIVKKTGIFLIVLKAIDISMPIMWNKAIKPFSFYEIPTCILFSGNFNRSNCTQLLLNNIKFHDPIHIMLFQYPIHNPFLLLIMIMGLRVKCVCRRQLLECLPECRD